MKEKKQKNIFVQGAIDPAFIGESIAKHQTKTDIGGHSIFLGQVRADAIDGKTVAAIEYTTYEEMALEQMSKIREHKKGYWPGRDDFYDFIKTIEYGYEAGLKSGRKESLMLFAELLRALTDKRFPGTKLYGEVEAVGDPVKLQQLCLELDAMPEAETLRRKLSELRQQD